MLWKKTCAYLLDVFLMGTNNICFYREMNVIEELSPNTPS